MANKWKRIADSLNISVEELQDYYARLIEDRDAIDSGNVPRHYPGLHPTPPSQILGSKRSRMEDNVTAIDFGNLGGSFSALYPSGPMGQNFGSHNTNFAGNSVNFAPSYPVLPSLEEIFGDLSDGYAGNSVNLAPNQSVGEIVRDDSGQIMEEGPTVAAFNSDQVPLNYPVLPQTGQLQLNNPGLLQTNRLQLNYPGLPQTGQLQLNNPGLLQTGLPNYPDLLQTGLPNYPDLPQKGLPNYPDIPQTGLPNYPDLPQTGYNIGRWSPAEHDLFLQGLNQHGRGAWKEIQRDYVQTRTRAQINSHAQAYFDKQGKNTG